MYKIDPEREELEITACYNHLLATCKANKGMSSQEEDDVYRAFMIAKDAHSGTRRKSGEPYIFHPLAVAQIAAEEVGLGPIAVVSALLHDVVEDTDITLEQIKLIFGERVSRIVDGVTKIEDAIRLQRSESKQAENYRKILLAMCDDAYVIFLKLCDRLHNMRTLESMSDTKKLAISSETQYLYIPLAHRLGLYNIKTELEELVMRYTNPGPYAEISAKINKTADVEKRLKTCFTAPIRELLDKNGYDYCIKTRVKSVYSCWKKIQNKGVDFDEIYDLYAMRIILNVQSDHDQLQHEKEECFKVYALLSRLFPPNPTRFRDWITAPKNNGYESLHTTLMSPIGRWVEVQIRTTRMDEIAEKGMAAHFLYKEAHPEENIQENPVEDWLRQIRTTLENTDKSALDLVEEFKETLYTKEIYLFTPKGENIKLPAHSSVLDFAYAIHTELGHRCIGAKVNARVVPIDYKLHSGEQVQVLTSKKACPTEEWLEIAQTQRAKDHIKDFLRDQKRQYSEEGCERLKALCKSLRKELTESNLLKIRRYFNLSNDIDLYYQVAIGNIDREKLARCFGTKKMNPQMFFLGGKWSELSGLQPLSGSPRPVTEHTPFLIDKEYENFESRPAQCCKPVQGDEVVGIVTDGHIEVHRTNCPNAMHEMSTHENHTIRAKWLPGEKVTFLTGISLAAIDQPGLLQELTRIISEEMDLNMRAITLETSEGIVRGIIMLYVHNVEDLNHLMEQIRNIEGVEDVRRI